MKLFTAISMPILLAICFAAGLSPVQSAPTVSAFAVDDSSDLVDSHPGKGVCAAANGHCTLRAAIQEANAQFAAAGGQYTITLPSAFYGLTITDTGGEINAAS